MSFEITPRRALIVHLHNTRQARQLRRFGIVKYISDAAKYAIIYMNDDEIEQKAKLIDRLGFVASVEITNWPEVDTTVGSDNENIEFAIDDEDLADENPITDEEL